ncbi:MAG: hypothetical protein NUV84_03485 [Candidatus Uhrbacteria bacterium]|nr:hypothetical protein [Candidatus Uhrbacteria bacterium]
MKKKKVSSGMVIYQAKNGAIELRGDAPHETIWATLDQIADVFGRDKSVISRHLKNIYKEGELEERSTVAKNVTVQIETGYDLSPLGIRTALALSTVKYADTCTWGHFGRGFSWDT